MLETVDFPNLDSLAPDTNLAVPATKPPKRRGRPPGPNPKPGEIEAIAKIGRWLQSQGHKGHVMIDLLLVQGWTNDDLLLTKKILALLAKLDEKDRVNVETHLRGQYLKAITQYE